jgi:hypothetical protein
VADLGSLEAPGQTAEGEGEATAQPSGVVGVVARVRLEARRVEAGMAPRLMLEVPLRAAEALVRERLESRQY